MLRALAPLPMLLFAVACEPVNTGDRITITLAGGEPTVRMDLEPLTLAAEVDNFVEIEVAFEAPTTATSGEPGVIEFTQYRIDYGLGDEEAPYIAGEVLLSVEEGGTGTLLLLGAVDQQLNWVEQRYTGGEFRVPARVSLAGVYGLEGVTAFAEYTATFADYR